MAHVSQCILAIFALQRQRRASLVVLLGGVAGLELELEFRTGGTAEADLLKVRRKGTCRVGRDLRASYRTSHERLCPSGVAGVQARMRMFVSSWKKVQSSAEPARSAIDSLLHHNDDSLRAMIGYKRHSLPRTNGHVMQGSVAQVHLCGSADYPLL